MASPETPPSDEESHFDVFVSYARLDNTTGWVTSVVDSIRLTRPQDGSPPLRVFQDTAEIRGMDDWHHRLEGALRRSRVLLVFLSPNYRKSDFCQWECVNAGQEPPLFDGESALLTTAHAAANHQSVLRRAIPR
jgi:hypothetical protein